MNKNYYLIFLIFFSVSFMVESFGQTDARVKIKGITIYIDYPDVPAKFTPVRIDSIINGIGYQEAGVQRTFRKYWFEQSRRNFDFTHDIFFYRAPKPSTYYESITWQEGILLWKNALEYIISQNPQYSWNSLSLVDDQFNRPVKGGLASVMVISSKWGPKGVGAAHSPNWTLSNNVKVNSIYGSVLQSPWDTTPVNMFMTLHESGHGIFGFPDTYDTEGGSEHSGGTGFYCLMSGGLPDVEPIGGPFLCQYKWGMVLEPPSGVTEITLRTDGDSIVVMRNPYDPFEYFTIEARNRSTIGNSKFPQDRGLLIWHSDNKVSTSNRLSDRTPLKHYRHSIEQADGNFELEKTGDQRGDAGDIFLPGNSFTLDTEPDTRWWDGRTSGIALTNIRFTANNHISFTITIPEDEIRFPVIPQDEWRLVTSTLPLSGYEGTRAFDGNSNTYFHVPWGNSYSRPHEIVIDLGRLYQINEFFYTANTNTSPPWEGRIADYKIYLSQDGVNWGTGVASGTFFYTGLPQYVLFPKTQGRYLKFASINSWLGNGTLTDVRTSIAEISLRGSIYTFLDRPDETAGRTVSVFPNPVNDLLHIQSPDFQKALVEIYSLDGILLKARNIEGSASMNVSDLPVGCYFIRTKTDGYQQIEKIIKIRPTQ